jgi:hypothetical protein
MCDLRRCPSPGIVSLLLLLMICSILIRIPFLFPIHILYLTLHSFRILVMTHIFNNRPVFLVLLFIHLHMIIFHHQSQAFPTSYAPPPPSRPYYPPDTFSPPPPPPLRATSPSPTRSKTLPSVTHVPILTSKHDYFAWDEAVTALIHANDLIGHILDGHIEICESLRSAASYLSASDRK